MPKMFLDCCQCLIHSDEESYMSDDSIQNEAENEAGAQDLLGDSGILQFGNSDNEDRTESDALNDTIVDTDFTLDPLDSQISDSSTDSDTESYTQPTPIERGRGKTRMINVRQRGRGRDSGSKVGERSVFFSVFKVVLFVPCCSWIQSCLRQQMKTCNTKILSG